MEFDKCKNKKQKNGLCPPKWNEYRVNTCILNQKQILTVIYIEMGRFCLASDTKYYVRCFHIYT